METKKVKNRTEVLVFILAVLGILVAANYVSVRWFKRIDMTENKQYSVSKATRNILQKLDDIVNVKVYFSKNLPPNLHKTVTDVKDILSEYQAYAGKKLRISWEDTENEDVKKAAQALGIPEIQMQTFERDKAQVINGFLGIAVLFEDKKEALPVVQNLQNLEYDLTLAIMKVSRTAVPKVGILKTDTMPYVPPNIRSQMNMSDQTEEKYAPVFENLRQNYEVQTVDLSDGTPIDSSIRTLIVPGGSSFTDRKIFEIDQYFMKGGSLIILADAVKVSFEYGVNGSVQESKILDLLEFYGVRVERNMVLDPSCGQVTIPQKYGPFSMNVPVPYPYFVRVGQDGFDRNSPAVAPLSDVILPWTSSLTLLVDKAGAPKAAASDSASDAAAQSASSQSSVSASVLATSTDKSWAAAGNFDLNPQQKWNPPSAGELKSHTLAAYLSGDFKSYFQGKSVPPVKESDDADPLSKINLQPESTSDRNILPSNTKGHMVVVGDADFVAGQNATPNNLTFLLNVVDWLTLDDNLISIRTRAIKDRTIDSDLLKEGSAKPNIIRIINIVVMPILIIIVGIILFLKRRETIAVPVTSQSEKAEDKNK